MDSSKKAAFVRKMGKKTLKLTKRREHFDGGGIAGLLGTGGGLGGSGYDVTSGTNAQQINDAYNQAQQTQGTQNAFTSTVLPGAQQGAAAEQTISGQLAGEALGQGPNVAQNQLNTATAGNVANQAALLAGQRGASANVGLQARQAAMAGTNAQQQSAGQAATLGAQQQIAAQTAGANLAGSQINQGQTAVNASNQAAQGEQNILEGANTANNNITGALAGATQKNNQNLLGSLTNTAGGIASIFGAHGGEVAESHPASPTHGHKKLDFIHKMAKMGLEHFDSGGIAVPQIAVNGVPQANFTQAQPIQGGFTPDNSPGYEFKPKAKSEKKPVAMGTTDVATNPNITGGNMADPNNMFQNPAPVSAGDVPSFVDKAAHGGVMGHFQNYFAKGGDVPAMLSPGEIRLSPDQAAEVAQGQADPLKIGEKIPGKAKVKGDSYKNDIIPKTLQEGDVIVDREHVGNSDKAAKFVRRSIAKKKAGRR